ncbi:hypothetical protein PJI16_06025 [Nitrospira sp. MA-1]|nr:hypothetical protein [Nitrospira sp. MA-1]
MTLASCFNPRKRPSVFSPHYLEQHVNHPVTGEVVARLLRPMPDWPEDRFNWVHGSQALLVMRGKGIESQ